MLGCLAAALAASTAAPASATPEPAVLEAAAPWWERITVTVDGEGTQQSCRYETSAAGARACDAARSASIRSSGNGTAGQFKKLTFERRFSPGDKLDAGTLQPGDTLLGRQVMFLTIDARGAIDSCRIVSSSGDAPPDYGCEEVKKEQFRAEATAARQAFLTVLAYGHSESVA